MKDSNTTAVANFFGNGERIVKDFSDTKQSEGWSLNAAHRTERLNKDVSEFLRNGGTVETK